MQTRRLHGDCDLLTCLFHQLAPVPVSDSLVLQVDKQRHGRLELLHVLLQVPADGQLADVLGQLLELPDVGLDVICQCLGV